MRTRSSFFWPGFGPGKVAPNDGRERGRVPVPWIARRHSSESVGRRLERVRTVHQIPPPCIIVLIIVTVTTDGRRTTKGGYSDFSTVGGRVR